MQSAGKSVGSLPLCLPCEGELNLPPWSLEVYLLCQQKLGFWSTPVKQFLRLPTPFKEVHNGCSQGPTDAVPGILLLLELVVGLSPGLLQGWELLGWPCLDQVVNSLDVVYQDLITGIDVALGMNVIGDIQQASRMVSKVFAHAVA